ncbi:hypothetical protein [Acidipropionibacterium acidipropionici]|uniref:hypothetical protein n=1 Tax=Acidipropionibacterium acidipropionici TaxID=1748 RepID=UPI00110B74B1|nr:hypothetical protein [Acidipropionibacterium acidipropionici]QCV95725.1 hypothetical protein FEZ30_11095 [Acidipropionibacterium acidipropionici]
MAPGSPETGGEASEGPDGLEGPQIDAGEVPGASQSLIVGSFEYYRALHPEAGPRMWQFLADCYADNGGEQTLAQVQDDADRVGGRPGRAHRAIVDALAADGFRFETR